MWLILKEPQFKVPLLYSWKYLVLRPYKFAKVRQGMMEQGEACNERGARVRGRVKEQGKALVLHGGDMDLIFGCKILLLQGLRSPKPYRTF